MKASYKFKFVCILTAVFISSNNAHALSVEPNNWQSNSDGLLSTSNSLNKTAGLNLQVTLRNEQWPALSTSGGALNSYGNMVFYDKHSDPIGINLGDVRIPNTTMSSFTEAADWAHNRIIMNSGAAYLTVSRLSPSVLIELNVNSVVLFGGTISGARKTSVGISNISGIFSLPKYVAYSTPSGIKIEPLTSSSTNFDDMDKNWILLWHGNNSYYFDTRLPNLASSWDGVGYGGESSFLKYEDVYQSDIPILATFSQKPSRISHSDQGGVQIEFSNNNNSLAFMPLFGDDHPEATETEMWGASKTLPTTGRFNVIDRISFWSQRMCEYPYGVNEHYDYDTNTDTSIIETSFKFKGFCPGIKYAPIPPYLALAMDKIDLIFSSPLTDGKILTNAGPLWGIDSTTSYSWKVSGLSKYMNSKRILLNGNVPTNVIDTLTKYIDKIIQAGHMSPWLFNDKMPTQYMQGEIYWLNPADSLLHLAEVLEVLPEDKKLNLINYMISERNNQAYDPEIIYNLPLTQGTFRSDFAITKPEYLAEWGSKKPHGREDAFYDHTPLFTYYSLSKYYAVTKETIKEQTLENAKKTLEKDFTNIDWATSSKFQEHKVIFNSNWPGFAEKRNKEAVVEQNRRFAGLIGFIKIAEKIGDVDNAKIAKALFVKSALSRLAMNIYPRYLYRQGLIKLPNDPKWMISRLAGKTSAGYNIFNYIFSDPNGFDDSRQVGVQDQFETRLIDLRPDAFMLGNYYTSYRDMVPELFRFLNDSSPTDLKVYKDKIQKMDSLWFMTLRSAVVGQEHGLQYPIDAFQLFMAQVFISREEPENLYKYTDIPWLAVGDLFYAHKLAETIKAYRGWEWETGSGTPCTLKADFDCNGSVNIVDLSTLLRNFGKASATRSEGDVSGDGTVNISDLSEVIREFGKTQ